MGTLHILRGKVFRKRIYFFPKIYSVIISMILPLASETESFKRHSLTNEKKLENTGKK